MKPDCITKHRERDNEYGVTWCTLCGKLMTKPSGKPLDRNFTSHARRVRSLKQINK